MAISHVLLNDAHRQFLKVRYIQIAALTVGAVTLFVPGSLALILAIVVLVLQAFALFLRHRGQQLQSSGDELRRRGLIRDVFPQSDQAYAVSHILSVSADDVRSRAEGAVVDDYFASSEESGVHRLLDNLAENAFWNSALYSRAASRGSLILGSTIAVTAVLVLLSIAIVSQDAVLLSTRIAVALVAFVIGFTYATDVLALRAASRTVGSLTEQIEGLRKVPAELLCGHRLGDLMAIFAEYTVATSKVPPIPQKLYDSARSKLNRLWAEKCAGADLL